MATAKQQQAFARLGMTAEGVAKAMAGGRDRDPAEHL